MKMQLSLFKIFSRQRDKQIDTDGLGVNFLTKVVVIKLQIFFKVKGIDFPSLEICVFLCHLRQNHTSVCSTERVWHYLLSIRTQE